MRRCVLYFSYFPCSVEPSFQHLLQINIMHANIFELQCNINMAEMTHRSASFCFPFQRDSISSTRIKNIKNVTTCRGSRSAKSIETKVRMIAYCMKPCKMKAPNCTLFSLAHTVYYIIPGKYSTGNTAPYTLQ